MSGLRASALSENLVVGVRWVSEVGSFLGLRCGAFRNVLEGNENKRHPTQTSLHDPKCADVDPKKPVAEQNRQGKQIRGPLVLKSQSSSFA